ncbi:hypothetical protein ACVWXN_003193 [Bradyrhizobium sp. i1.4.4]
MNSSTSPPLRGQSPSAACALILRHQRKPCSRLQGVFRQLEFFNPDNEFSRPYRMDLAEIAGDFLKSPKNRIRGQVADGIRADFIFEDAHQPDDFGIGYTQADNLLGGIEDTGLKAVRPAEVPAPP